MHVQAAIDIQAPAALVFDLVATPERLPQWNTTVTRAARVGQAPVGLGSRAIASGSLFGQRIEGETEVVAFEPPRLFATRAIRGPRLQTIFRLDQYAFGTHVRVEADGDVPGGSLGSLVGGRVLSGELNRSLAQLRALCEEEARRQAASEPRQGGDPACWAHLTPEGQPKPD